MKLGDVYVRSIRSLRLAFLAAALFALPSGCLAPASEVCAQGVICAEGTVCNGQQNGCIAINATCGDGQSDGDEMCDDGNNVSGDGCKADCTSDEKCGNGRTDDHLPTSDPRYETCDDGNEVDRDGCRSDCKSTEECGNGTVDDHLAVPEVCDDGNEVNNDNCRSDCLSNERCGNGVLDTHKGEVCDDGNTTDGDTCSSDCKSGNVCGNGIVNPGEACDPIAFTAGNRTDTGECNAGESASDPHGCKTPVCGDGYTNEAFDPSPATEPGGEQCDTAGVSSTCDADCSFPICGDGIVNTQAGEECDVNSDTLFCNGPSAPEGLRCKAPVCGDGYENTALEQCDDGDNDPATPGSDEDACTNACKDNVCGDAIVNKLDDPNTAEADQVEACDLGAEQNAWTTCPYDTPTCDGCADSCKTPMTLTGAFCGDGFDNGPSETTEACDLGPENEKIECDYGEQQCDLCYGDCQTSVVGVVGEWCGDGIRQVDEEACDFASENGKSACDYGDSLCDLCSADCDTLQENVVGEYCGDGVDNGPDPTTEACDEGSSNGRTACDYGTATCSGCSTTCGTTELTGPYCGDGTPQTDFGEVCDDGAENGSTTCDYSNTGNTCEICNADCLGSAVHPAPHCGDGTTNGPESCDDGSTTCGTCNSTCMGSAHLAAKGSVTLSPDVAGSKIKDGETLTIGDGRNPPVVFEFDKDGGTGSVGSGHRRIAVTNGDSPENIAALIAAAVQLVVGLGTDPDPLEVSAEVPLEAPRTVVLTNGSLGGHGNQPVLETVAHTGFSVSGMSGGGGEDCDVGQRCKADVDCLPGLFCSTETQVCAEPPIDAGVPDAAVADAAPDASVADAAAPDASSTPDAAAAADAVQPDATSSPDAL